jgi:hypothetical protein
MSMGPLKLRNQFLSWAAPYLASPRLSADSRGTEKILWFRGLVRWR